MPTPVSRRVRKHRDALRAAGLRPVQIWVPDTRRPALRPSAAARPRLWPGRITPMRNWTASRMRPWPMWMAGNEAG